jgi:acyl-CoA thioester hydrolase
MTESWFRATGSVVTVPITVRWSECDAAGIIYHAHVFDWFSEGRIAWLKALGISYYEVLRPIGFELLVLECQARFLHTLKPGDDVWLDVAAAELTPTRVSFYYRVRRQDQVMAEGVTRHVFVVAGHAVNLRKRAPDLYELWARHLAHTGA